MTVNSRSDRFSPQLFDLLARGRMGNCRLTPDGSNYTFLTTVSKGGERLKVIYKPRRGEMPLWDFPGGTLYLREYASYLLSEALGWGYVPPTVIRDGEFGEGSVQLYVECDRRQHYFTLRERFIEDMFRVCAFDVVANNADRKATHTLLGNDGGVWLIDHGITFNAQYKLRTVIWDFAGQQLPHWLLEELESLRDSFDAPGGLGEGLSELLSKPEVDATRYRLRVLIDQGEFPVPTLERAVPWPWL